MTTCSSSSSSANRIIPVGDIDRLPVGESVDGLVFPEHDRVVAEEFRDQLLDVGLALPLEPYRNCRERRASW